MFTGLIEEKGVVITVAQVTTNGPGCDITIAAARIVDGISIGDSVAINGCCLTVTKIDGHQLTFQAGTETLSRTHLGLLKPGGFVNLERALRVGDRLGGHYVTGHIDGVGRIANRTDQGDWSEFWISVPDSLTRQMASKGSVAVDGVSLTLVNVERDQFSVALIPHTLAETTLGDRKTGDRVNIETDILAKYVEQQIRREQNQF